MHINCNNIVILIIVCVGETIPDYNYIIIADKGRTTGHACHLYLNWDKSQSPKSSVRIKIILLNRPRVTITTTLLLLVLLPLLLPCTSSIEHERRRQCQGRNIIKIIIIVIICDRLHEINSHY